MNTEIILGICGALITFDKVIDIVLKFKHRAEDPNIQLKTRISVIESDIEKMKGFLANDKVRLDMHDKGVSVLQKSILALIDNAIDDSDKTPLIQAKHDLNEFLINRQLEM